MTLFQHIKCIDQQQGDRDERMPLVLLLMNLKNLLLTVDRLYCIIC